MPHQIGNDSTGMHRKSPYPTRRTERIQMHGEQRIGSLGLTVGPPWIVGLALEIPVIKVDGAVHMPP